MKVLPLSQKNLSQRQRNKIARDVKVLRSYWIANQDTRGAITQKTRRFLFDYIFRASIAATKRRNKSAVAAR